MLFQKGHSGNPGGRPKVESRIRELAQQHGEKAIETLVCLMNDERQPALIRISAAEKLLDRGFGRPRQMPDAWQEDEPKPEQVDLLTAARDIAFALTLAADRVKHEKGDDDQVH